MKFSQQALLSVTAAASFFGLWVVPNDAFLVPHQLKSSLSSSSSLIVNNNYDNELTPQLPRFGIVTRRNSLFINKMALNDDDDDEDDYEDDDDDDEVYDPLAKGIDSVGWLPSVVGAKNIEIKGAAEGTEILPLFPLGGFVYTPNTEHVLNIFEPRYRQMYSDILMNGTKRFVVVTSHPQEKGRFAEMGVLFELEDLKEVSEVTNDRIKYICNHKVTGRVKIHKILNPQAWSTQETYLKVVGTIYDDSGKKQSNNENDNNDDSSSLSENTTTVPAQADIYASLASSMGTKEEEAVRKSFAQLVKLQHELEEDVRFTKVSVDTLAVKDGSGKDSLWQTIRLWQSFADQRLIARQNELQSDFQEKLQQFLQKEKGVEKDEMPSSIGFQELSAELQEEVKALQKRMSTELKPLALEQSLTMQKILEAKDHKSRCKLLQFFIDAERKRLDTKKSLQGIFSASSSSSDDNDTKTNNNNNDDDASVPEEERITNDTTSSNKKTFDPPTSSPSKSVFYDEPDAFQ